MPIEISANDEELNGLSGEAISSSLSVGVRYLIGRRLGGGGMSVTYLALRHSPEGQCAVVLKIMRAGLARSFSQEAALSACKEAVSLGRLNERVPTTPYVVRLIDTGSLLASMDGQPVEMPWLVLEYVHGGGAGTTLTDRVAHSIAETGSAFDPERAAHAIDCLARGIDAIHEVGVIHRDLKPDNVLCCGFGDDEMFKIADFGIARPAGVAATFGGGVLGTVGYAPPELIDTQPGAVGTWSDVFSLAAVIYYLLTGEDYILARSVTDAFLFVQQRARRSLLEAVCLPPSLRARPQATDAIDAALARASSPKSAERPAIASALATAVLPHLRVDAWRQKRAQRPHGHSAEGEAGQTWSWMPRHVPMTDQVVRSVAWDGDGTCLVATTRGLSFWDGTAMRDAPVDGLPDPTAVRFVRRLGPRKWLVACDAAMFATYTERGVSEVRHFSDEWARVDLFSGDIADLAIAVGQTAEGPMLLALSGRRWLKPFPLDDVASVTSVARVDDASWLLAGRSREGHGFAAVYSPLNFEIQQLEVPVARALLACAGDAALQIGLVAGTDGAVIWYEHGAAFHESVPIQVDLSAAGVDPEGGGWIAGGGRIFTRLREPSGARWRCVWEADQWSAPIVSLLPDVGVVIAMTADGGILEGRILSGTR